MHDGRRREGDGLRARGARDGHHDERREQRAEREALRAEATDAAVLVGVVGRLIGRQGRAVRGRHSATLRTAASTASGCESPLAGSTSGNVGSYRLASTRMAGTPVVALTGSR